MNHNEAGVPIPDSTKPFIILELRTDGNLEMSTNVQMEFMALGILELAKKAVNKAFTRESSIVAAPASVLQSLNS